MENILEKVFELRSQGNGYLKDQVNFQQFCVDVVALEEALESLKNHAKNDRAICEFLVEENLI